MWAVASMKSDSSTALGRPRTAGWGGWCQVTADVGHASSRLKRKYADLSLENVVLKGVITKEL